VRVGRRRKVGFSQGFLRNSKVSGADTEHGRKEFEGGGETRRNSPVAIIVLPIKNRQEEKGGGNQG